MYFDTQYAYESMAITLVVWALVAYVRAIRSERGRGRASWSVLTAVLAAGTVITHHLSMITLVLTMALVSAALSLTWLAKGPGWVRTAVTAWGLTLAAGLMAIAWFHFIAPATLSYLSPYIGQGLSELTQVVKGSGGARQLFGASLSPGWEQKSAYLVPVFAAGLALGGLLLLRRQIRDGSPSPRSPSCHPVCVRLARPCVFSVHCLYSCPRGAEGARRSWAFTWIGLCILAAPAVVWLLDWMRAAHTPMVARQPAFGALGCPGYLIGRRNSGWPECCLQIPRSVPIWFRYALGHPRAAWDEQLVYGPVRHGQPYCH